MGCDSPSKKEHVLTIGGDIIRTRTCPRKLARPANKYIHAHRWAKEGRLGYIYGEDDLPAKVMEAIDLIDQEQDNIISKRMEGK